MNSVELKIETVYDSVPCSLKIISNHSKVIFEGKLKENLTLNFDYPESKEFILSIEKTGKDLKVVEKEHQQTVIIKSLTINSCSLYPEKFGMFQQKNNLYLKDVDKQTNILSLNGVWNLKLPLFNIKGISTLDKNRYRDPLEDCDVACFGCSFTHGSHLLQEETWPSLLGKTLNKKINNYGIPGSSNQEILANALEYSKKYKTKDVVLLLTHVCRFQLFLPETKEVINWLLDVKKYKSNVIDQLSKDLIMYGEDLIVLGSQIPTMLDIINSIGKNIKGKVFLSSWIRDQYDVFSEIKGIKERLLPYFEQSKEFTNALDGTHPGPDHYKQWVEKIKTKFLYV